MATVEAQGTKFTFSVYPKENGSDKARVKIGLENEFVSYEDTENTFLENDIEEWIFSSFRLLAGAYKREVSLTFERAGFAVDLYPYTNEVGQTTRQERRENDCVMAIRLLMRSVKSGFLGGVYTLLLHREEVEYFAKQLRLEFENSCVQRVHGRGEYRFIGVSPLGYTGCNYWYLDSEEFGEAGGYVWVRMGKRNVEQIVCVDGVRYFSEENAPYPPERVKRTLRRATEEEVFSAFQALNEASQTTL